MPRIDGSGNWLTLGFSCQGNSTTPDKPGRSQYSEQATKWRSSMIFGKKKKGERAWLDTRSHGIFEPTILLSPVVRMVMSVLFASGLSSCQAPQPVIEADDLATKIEDEFVSAVGVRLEQWRRELGHSWNKELRMILESELNKAADAEGKVAVTDILSLLAAMEAARAKNIERLDLERQADNAATDGWRESRKIRDSIRRWMMAGMTQEERNKIYETVIEVTDK